MKNSKLQIKTKNGSYLIIIGSNLVGNFKKILKKNSINSSKFLVIIDSKVPKKYSSLIVKDLNIKNKVIKFLSNEKNKNQKNVQKILDILLKENFNRNDCVISVGGGILGDLAAFASSIFKRGIIFVNVPTTLLSQVDSSIGGKTGINTRFGKNLIGSFYQPRLVLSDTNFLKSLPKREIICGYAEIFKHSLISNKKFYKYLSKNFSKILSLKKPYIQKSIYESCVIKKNIVEKDEKEQNLRKLLNLGHTFAHSYEATLGYSKKLNHGEAVLLGIKSACLFSLEEKILNKKECELILEHINNINNSLKLKSFFKKKDINKIIKFMISDKKNTSKDINLILLKKIGEPTYENQFKFSKIKGFLKNQLNNI